MKTLAVALLLAFAPVGFASAGIKPASVRGSNTQSVTVSGTVINRADSGGKARVNLGSVVGSDVGANSQTVQVNGSIVNEARGNGKADVNIGSVVEAED